MKKLFLFAAAMFVGLGSTQAAKYVKVTAAPTDWSGEYLLVYEYKTDTAYVFTGVDATSNFEAAVIDAKTITSDEFITLTIAKQDDGYSLKVNGGTNNGKYLYGNATSNKLNFHKDPQKNTIEMSTTGVVITNGKVLQFNNGKTDHRFRYYTKDGQKPVQLYKLKKEGGAPVAVTAINAVNAKDTVEVEDQLELQYTITPDSATDQRVAFAITEGATYATLNKTILTGVAAGDVTVKVTALDSLNKGDKLTANYSIYVKPVVYNTCAEVNATTVADVQFRMNPVTVVYVNGSNNYVKDASGSTLIYQYSSGLNAGDVVAGIKGKSSPYNGLPELKPTNKQADWTITPGTAPEIPVATAAPVAADANKVLTWNDVKIEGTFTTSAKDRLLGVYGKDTISFYNYFKIAQTFEAGKTYNITGAVSINNAIVEVYFISAEEVLPVASARIMAYDLRMTKEGVNCTFTFKANIDAKEANLVFYKNGAEVSTLPIEVKAGANTVNATEAEIGVLENDTLTWGVELSADYIKDFTMVYREDVTTKLQRKFLEIDNNPESDYFGRIYSEDRIGSGNCQLAAYNADYTNLNSNIATAGNVGRPAVDAKGYIYWTDYGDATSGVYYTDPATLNGKTQIFQGTRAGSGMFSNTDGVDMCGSTMAAFIEGSGKDTKLYVSNEDAGVGIQAMGCLVFNLGQEDGSIVRSWDKAPSKSMTLSHNAGSAFSIRKTAKGLWWAQNRGKGQNLSANRSLMFYNNADSLCFESTNTTIFNGSNGGGMDVSADEKELVIVNGDGDILVFDIEWEGTVPTLTLRNTFKTNYAALASISYDYAGNLVCAAGTYGTDVRLTVYAMPTDDNTVTVPAQSKQIITHFVATSINQFGFENAPEVKKVIMNGKLYIIRDNVMYTIDGQVVK